MRYLYVILSLFILIITLSCNGNSKIELIKTQDSIYISKNSEYLLFAYYEDKNKQGYFAYYDNYDTAISFINLSTKKNFSTPIPPTRMVDVKDLNDFYIQNFDSIILQNSYQISIIDTSGKLKYRHIINSPFSDKWPDTIHNSLGSLFSMYLDNTTNELFLQQYSGKYYSWSKSYYELPFQSAFNLRDSTFRSIPVFYPEKYLHNYYGAANNIYHTVVEGNEVFSFEADENIYVFNKKSGSTKKYNCKSSFDTSSIKPLSVEYKDDINKKMDYLTVSPFYLKILHDPFRNLYYRFFSAQNKLRNKDGTYNSNADKQLFLMVIDKNFNVIKEIPLDNNEWYWSFVNKNGLYLQRTPKFTINESTQYGKKIVFDIYNFSVN